MVSRCSIAKILVACVASVSAAPSLLRGRQGPTNYQPGCENAPVGSSAFANDFTLTALNATLPNSNSTGVPLAVGSIGGGDGAELYSLSTYATYPYEDRPNFELFEGRLFAWGRNQHNAVAGAPESGGVLPLISPSQGVSEQAFCVTPRGNDLFSLAVNGDADNWWLCPDPFPRGQVRVYYNATADNDGDYDFEACYAVELLLSAETVA